VLRQFGEEDYHPGQKDYFLLDENLGLWQHKIETNNLEMVRLIVIESLRRLLQGYPNWEIAIALASPDMENVWPAMGLVIRDDEIIDGLQRQYFPKEFQTIAYEGSRPQGSRFGDIIYSEPGPF
jgi:hypothetical protein